MNKQRKADLLLVMVTAFWGVSYFLVDLCLTDLPPLTLNAFRFLVAFFLLAAVFYKKMRPISAATVKYSLLVGVFLMLVYVCCTYGVMYTSISNAGFICALPAVTPPVLNYFFTGQKPGRRLTVCILLCAVGLALLTLNEAFRPALGDVICLGVALFYALDLIFTEKAVARPDVDPLQMGVLELGVVGVIYIAVNTNSSAGKDTPLGILCLVAAVISGCLYGAFSRKASSHFSPFEVSYIACMMAATFFNSINVIRHLIKGDLLHYFDPYFDPQNLIGFVFLAIFCTVLAASMNNYALGRLPVTTVTAFGGISTFVTIAIGCLIGKERLYGFHFIGLTLIVIRMVGVSWITIRDAKRKAAK